jgi:16S rRNA (adenine1518-N6/adenine1519-N6)-dimethyltransferase
MNYRYTESVNNPGSSPSRPTGSLRGSLGWRNLAQETRTILRTNHVRPREQLGQNFLIDYDALQSVVAAAGLLPGMQVLEIGPGIGTLTLALAETDADVVALELDATMARISAARTVDHANVRIREGNVLHADLADILDVSRDFKVVANIPYYITAPILRLFLEGPYRPSTLVLMVQREVGERLAAKPGKMSALSVFAQVYARVEVMRQVPATSFLPPPDVASAILRLRVHENPPVPVDELSYLFTVVKAGFGAKRKMIHNSLDRGLPNPGTVIDDALLAAGIERTRRAETLSLPEWRTLAKALRRDVDNLPKSARAPRLDDLSAT